jgi:small subunit ribosomal protein S4
LLALLERRLDNLVYRAGFAATIWAARQLVSHGHIQVNGKRVNIPAYTVVPGQTITITEKMRQNPHVVESLESTPYTPVYMDVDSGNFSATLTKIPERGEIPVPVDESLIVEYYTRLT